MQYTVIHTKELNSSLLTQSDQLAVTRAVQVKEATLLSLKEVTAQKEVPATPPPAKRKRNEASSLENGAVES